MQVYAGLYKLSCDMCSRCEGWDYIIKHKDGSRAEICAVCYGKCTMHPPFQQGIANKEIQVIPR